MLTIGVRDFGKIMAENESGSSLVAFAKLAKALGYRDTSKRMPMTTRESGEVVQLGDIIELLKDNSFIFQNLVNSEEIAVQYFSEDKDLPEDVVVEIKTWMRKNVDNYHDDGELDCTGLAEDCANDLSIFTNADCDIHDKVFELAAEMDEDREE